MLIVLSSPRPVIVLRFGSISHWKNLIKFLQIFLQQLMPLFRRTDILILQAQPVLLVFLGYFLRHLPFFHCCQFRQFIFFSACRKRIILHCPHIPFFRLAGRQFYFFRTFFRRHRTNLHIPSIYRSDSGKQSSGSDIFLRHSELVQTEIKFHIIILPPREVGTDRYFLDAAVRQELLFQLFRPVIQFVIIIPIHFHPE